ncbi:aminodeoxychorismate lyase [Evansella cellulosilytica]|uniref:Aminotransferase class IV n=1 Tax=Evansella cellulosilytica (strain ATCC 21833 / DSM 2522 / FERM P-1141 / JCM 9156 / N-4) TaxID=649639 RepID=E6TSF2_EVAC2|nr:aminodeoxychorismate lyase [Evansella cellulosilytica]ADU28367.1 aminotransferase class IV [Evansella cellulosilytica DSM 2522]
MYLYMNGSIINKEDASISPFDHGFLYGLGLFETFRTYDGHPFLLDDHFHRLQESADEMGIILPTYKREKVEGVIRDLLEANQLKDGYFRWNISAGEEEIGLTTTPYSAPNTIVFVKPLPAQQAAEKNGQLLSQRRNSPEGKYRLKSHHYLNNIYGKRETGNNPHTEGIFLTEDGFVSEGVVSNVFWTKNKTVYTPDRECGALDGITKQFVAAIANKCGINVIEGKFKKEALLEADEVFVTNSIQEIVPIKEIGDAVYKGMKGEVYHFLHNNYKKHTSTVFSREEVKGG